MLIDIHSYHLNKDEETTQVLSKNYNDSPLNYDRFFSIGAHPWRLDTFDFEKFKSIIQQHKNHENFFGIGEIGLDRLKGIEFESQIETFQMILEFAKKEEIKRLVIHSVKSYEEIITSLKKVGYEGQIIFHDYNASLDITKKLLKLNSFFSFGENILRNNSRAQKAILHIPHQRIFFESDEKDSPSEAYQKGNQLTGADFQKICQENFRKLF